MDVLVVRHAIAQERDEFAALMGQSDDLRPLTDKGQQKMRKNIKGLTTQLDNISVIAASPLVRAQQTAHLLQEQYSSADFHTLNALAPRGSIIDVLAYLKKQPQNRTVCLVGHEPDLGEMTTFFLSSRPDTWLPFKKGAACLLRFEHAIEAGEADLIWFLTPTQMRDLAK